MFPRWLYPVGHVLPVDPETEEVDEMPGLFHGHYLVNVCDYVAIEVYPKVHSPYRPLTDTAILVRSGSEETAPWSSSAPALAWHYVSHTSHGSLRMLPGMFMPSG